jgi:transketolase
MEARRLILNAINRSNAAHIGSCFSVVEILRAVYRSVDTQRIKTGRSDRDRVILSKGHAAAALYATLFQFGLMDKAELETYHRNDSLLGGHVSHFVPSIEHSTGALGHGLPVAVGMALGLRSKQFSGRVFVILGDGEMHEGANWEALMMAGNLSLGNLCVIVDNNRLSQIGRTELCCSLEPLKAKLESFRFSVTELNGHQEDEIYSTIQKSAASANPVAIVCETIKGRGVSFMEDANVWHYKTPKNDEYRQAIQELGGNAV